MSNKLKNNLNAIELTENDLDNVVGGNSVAAALNNAMNAQASHQMAQMQMAQMQMLLAASNKRNNSIKKTGQSLKSATQ
jgi:bacteriocin-like protein